MTSVFDLADELYPEFRRSRKPWTDDAARRMAKLFIRSYIAWQRWLLAKSTRTEVPEWE